MTARIGAGSPLDGLGNGAAIPFGADRRPASALAAPRTASTWNQSSRLASVPRRLDPEHLGDHLDRLYRAAWALCGNREEAEDLVQDTYARVLAKPRLLRNDDDLGYLMMVLRNTFVSSRRASARRPRADAAPEGFEPADPRSGARPDEMTESREVFAAIAELPEDFRDALVAIDVAGLSYREAGRLLGAKEATITTRLHRARNQVAHRLAPDPAGKEAGTEGVI
jgi:RNA polymerase sigma-70 factor, ECF subfamily